MALHKIEWAQGMAQPQDVELTAAAAISVGEVGYIDSSGRFAKALATGTGTIPAMLIAVDRCDANKGGTFRPWGVIVNKSWSWTAGNKLYLSTATAGAITASAPTTYILPIGIALSATAMLFYPSLQNDYTPNTRDDDTTLAEGVDLVLGTVTGSKFATTTGQKMAFWGKTPIVQPVSALQAVVGTTTGTAAGTTTGTAAGTTTGTVVGTTTGTVIGTTTGTAVGTTTGTAAGTTTGTVIATTVITTAATSTAPYGFADATQANDIAAICAAMRDSYNIDRVRTGELIASYNIDRVRTGELIASYNIDRVRTGELIDSHNIDRVRVGELIASYNIDRVRTGELIASYNIDRVRTGELIASYNIDRVRTGEVIAFINQNRSDQVAVGIIKGAA